MDFSKEKLTFDEIVTIYTYIERTDNHGFDGRFQTLKVYWDDRMTKELAKKKDDGTYATLGMMYLCASYFDIDINSECVLYIVDTYLQNINYCTFREWIRSKEANSLIKECKSD